MNSPPFSSQKHSHSAVIYIIQSEMLESFNDWLYSESNHWNLTFKKEAPLAIGEIVIRVLATAPSPPAWLLPLLCYLDFRTHPGSRKHWDYSLYFPDGTFKVNFTWNEWFLPCL